MATNNVTMTSTDVRALPGYQSRRFNAGGTIYAGMPVYIDSGGSVQVTDADGSLTAMAFGIAIAGPPDTGGTVYTSGDRVDVVWNGPVTGYSDLTPGLPLYASTLAGQMQQAETFVGGNYITEVGIALSATVILVNPIRHLGPAEDGTHA